jgi:hypothetical protein
MTIAAKTVDVVLYLLHCLSIDYAHFRWYFYIAIIEFRIYIVTQIMPFLVDLLSDVFGVIGLDWT